MVDYKIVYSTRKTLAVQITRQGEVVVRSPKYVSKKRIEEFVFLHEGWIASHLEKVKNRISSEKELSPQEVSALKEKAHLIIPQKVKYYSDIMGLYPVGIKITSAKTRYGSCSGKNSLCFSLYLMQKSEEFIDYVVVHELAHIKYKNHSKQFHEFVAKFSDVNPKDYK